MYKHDARYLMPWDKDEALQWFIDQGRPPSVWDEEKHASRCAKCKYILTPGGIDFWDKNWDTGAKIMNQLRCLCALHEKELLDVDTE